VELVPGLLASARLYGEQLPVLWRLGSVTIADHTRDASMAAIASRILAAAPPSFALVGLSMGVYIAFEILRQAPDRVARLALLDTTARPDTQIALARGGRFAEVLGLLFPVLIHRNRQNDVAWGGWCA
jgi:pimeloyl-ACP methyl ester carboxylesterase